VKNGKNVTGKKKKHLSPQTAGKQRRGGGKGEKTAGQRIKNLREETSEIKEKI